MQTSLAGSIHPFVLADVLGISRHQRHADETSFAIEQIRGLLETAERHHVLRQWSPSNYFFSRAQLGHIRKHFETDKNWPEPDLHLRDERELTDRMLRAFNRLVSLGLVSSTPKVFEKLDLRAVAAAPRGALRMPLSAWVETGSDSKGYAIYNSPTGWPEGWPNAFDVHIPESGGVSGRLALAPVIIENDLYEEFVPALEHSDDARTCCDRLHIFDHVRNQLVYVSGLSPTNGDSVIIRDETGQKRTINASELLRRSNPKVA